MVNAVRNANMVGLNINPRLTNSIMIPRTTFNKPLVWLYSTSAIPFESRKIASNNTDKPKISADAITPNNGNAMIINPKIIAITLITVFLANQLPPLII